MTLIRKAFERLHYPVDIIAQCVRWFLAYSLSLRNLEKRSALSFRAIWQTGSYDRRCTFDRYQNIDRIGYRLKISDYSGGNHAITIWGVSKENNCVFYSNPNYSFLDKILQIDFGLFKNRLDSLYYFDHPYTFTSKTHSLASFKEF